MTTGAPLPRLVERELFVREKFLQVTKLPKFSLVFYYNPPYSDMSVVKTKRKGPFHEHSAGEGFNFLQVWNLVQRYTPRSVEGVNGYATMIRRRENAKKQTCYIDIEYMP